ncbi:MULTISPECIES: response regulator [Clostridium]|uniref:Transcriptional regulatory protein n=2 Tax=Clostridium TaxID=1485 RepID=A0A166SZ45_9CLOT|nr:MULTISPECIES: response regulator [Clostridium]OAA92984.1 Transcriptional regulatory protein DcuR [Clostridium coskatii]OBR90474.1 transcriptional regulatory protein DcuR [Clostridium coskatii]RMC98830.1 response regulator [Clostridium autoethanogenum]
MINVLIVEDDPMVAEFNKKYLSQVGGFKLKAVARSFEEAVKVLKTSDIQLILLDIYMPGLSGLELLSQVRKMGKEVDIIIVSAACDIQTIKRALQYGAVDYLIKPFEFDRFNSALSAYREAQNFMKQKKELSQTELDQLILNNREENQVFPQLPKGLDKNTLKKVWTKVIEMKEDTFSTSEIARYVGISRVSMKKYLSFLNKLGALRVEVIYGSVGRPIHKYKCVDIENSYIKKYICKEKNL